MIIKLVGFVMLTDIFNYDLPEELIAQKPSEKRSDSRLFFINRKNKTFEHYKFYDVVDLIPEGSLLVMNNSRVIPARVICKKENGVNIEVFLIRRTIDNEWQCLMKPAKRVKEGTVLTAGEGSFKVIVKRKTIEGFVFADILTSGDFWQVLEKEGQIPLPPYIKAELQDSERYQTVYSDRQEKGSVAAPTAGLHFTDELIDKLSEKGIDHTFVTLHVGPGTFRPVKTENIEDHKMDVEFYHISEDSVAKIEKAMAEKRKIIAVGTTSVRTLESAWGDNGKCISRYGSTDIFIYPGYKFKTINGLITNFHLPKSTLIMLVSAFAGTELVMSAYKKAVEERYRMYSFGDAMLIL